MFFFSVPAYMKYDKISYVDFLSGLGKKYKKTSDDFTYMPFEKVE